MTTGVVKAREKAARLCQGWLSAGLEPLTSPDVPVHTGGTCPRLTQRREAYGCVGFSQKQSRGMSTQEKLGGGCNDGDY